MSDKQRLPQPETWMVDYEHGDDEPQHAVLSWLDDEAKTLPEVGTQLVRKTDYDALQEAIASALTSLNTGPLKDGYAASVLNEALGGKPG